MRSLSGASFRLDTWKDTLRLAAASPLLGHGLGAFHDAYPRFKRGHGILRVEHAENDYLETLAETGALGLGLALAGLVLVFVSAGRARDTAPASGAARRRAGRPGGARRARGPFARRLQPPHSLERRARRARRSGRRWPRPERAPGRCRARWRRASALGALALAAATARLPERPGLLARDELSAAAVRGHASAAADAARARVGGARAGAPAAPGRRRVVAPARLRPPGARPPRHGRRPSPATRSSSTRSGPGCAKPRRESRPRLDPG